MVIRKAIAKLLEDLDEHVRRATPSRHFCLSPVSPFFSSFLRDLAETQIFSDSQILGSEQFFRARRALWSNCSRSLRLSCAFSWLHPALGAWCSSPSRTRTKISQKFVHLSKSTRWDRSTRWQTRGCWAGTWWCLSTGSRRNTS